jgi:ABC-type antimicrobial peptide transport system permease subunit
VFYLTYILAELRRRSGRTIVTAFGLAIGVGLVVTVNALTKGLDDAQARVLKPLTGVGTDISVTRPVDFGSSSGTSSSGGPFGFPQLSQKERQQLRQENGPRRFGFQNLKPGTHFSTDNFVSGTQLSFPASNVTSISKLSGVSSAAGGLTLNVIHLSGTVPKQTQFRQGGGQGGFGGRFGGGAGGSTIIQRNGPRSISFASITVSGVDQRNEQLGAITPAQITKGRFLADDDSRQAILDVSYASRESKTVGDTITLADKKYTVVGLAKTPLGGASSDVYVKLSQLQVASGRAGRVNTVYVRATSAGQVDAVARHIERTVNGASVTTAKTLADRITGSLSDAKSVASKLGTALSVVGLLAAFLIASLLTLSSVTKRIRELGTLKALGWSQRLVVRQVTGESLLQGLLGGMLGVVLGVAAAAAISAFAPALTATVASAATQRPFFGPFGQGQVTSGGAADVTLHASVSAGLIVVAVGLALLGGLIAGGVGGLRAARLRPADALRHID